MNEFDMSGPQVNKRLMIKCTVNISIINKNGNKIFIF